jgi:N-acetylneuraminate synthase
LLERVAATGKPTLLSSGMSDWMELDRAVATLRDKVPLVVMQCTSAYPCPPDRVGLNVVGEMQRRYGLAVGYSDHTDGPAAAMAAAALGAVVIEKHLTFSRRMYGSDAANAMEPEDFERYCRGIRDIWTMADNPVDKDAIEPLAEMKRIFEKSIVAARALPAGTVVGRGDLAFKKPGHGISAARYAELIGRRLRIAVPADHLFSERDFE